MPPYECPNKRNRIEILPLDLVHHIVDVSREGDRIARLVRAFTDTRERRRHNITALRGQAICDASPAPPAMPRAVHEYKGPVALFRRHSRIDKSARCRDASQRSAEKLSPGRETDRSPGHSSSPAGHQTTCR